ncbi:DNA alkylation repair protein [Gaoshiqia sediminis]|uniref:DNA alkylation repair protein n=1 Tax=Gaoshiqia sediminis TaxID=2986998 RepID=A0AA41Y7K2_9BACT|nr:DNA alkylation repair protein [Gaoshiqia sediminis]MCW0484874.1 DNA alkylation repair protein [Gaoshiqia sediminis]
MSHDQMINEMIAGLRNASTTERKAMAMANFPTRLEMLGTRAPDLKAIAKNWRNKLPELSPEQWTELCLELSKQPIFESQQLAYELLWTNKKALKNLTAGQVVELGQTLDNWASVDSYSTMIAGWHWREGTLGDEQIQQWMASEDRWMRRTALVCTVPLNLRAKGGTGDTRRTLMVCEQLIDDRDDMVIKALSWALRELSKSDRQAVVDFMAKHVNLIHTRVRREVTTKLTTGKKNG